MHSAPRWIRRAAGACFCSLASAVALVSGCARLLGIDELSGIRDAAPPFDIDDLPHDVGAPDAGIDTTCSEGAATSGAGSQSELVHKLVQGQQALVLVDGAAADSGQCSLNIQRVTCPDTDLEGQTFPLELSTLGFGDDLLGQCGGAGSEDRAYHWVAPADGSVLLPRHVPELHARDLVTAPQSFVLYALEGGDCGGAEVACHVASVDPASNSATATLSLEAGAEAATYTIVVQDRFLNEPGMGFTVEAQCFAVCGPCVRGRPRRGS